MEKINKKKVDIEAKLFMFLLNLREEKEKKYSFVEGKNNIAYIFKSYDEFKSYFLENGVKDVSSEVLEMCRMITTKNGTIIALKKLCDHTIKQYKMRKNLTQKEIDEIHARGKITPAEKVQEWESMGVCAPTNVERCHTFSNCHDCLSEYANSQEEYDKFELELKIVCKD